ncbi:MAG: RluA family pseudouridine synthase [Bacilli bacterium]
MEIKIIEEKDLIRTDVYLCDKLLITRSKILKHLKNGDILVNDIKVKQGYILKMNDVITINNLEENTSVLPQNIDINILYEDEYLIVVDKKSGMVVHPAPGNYSNTLVNALIHHSKTLSKVGGEFRPGIVHRIDKDTSGILVIAKTDKVHNILASGFKNKTIKRKYKALADGVINENTGKIDAPIGRSKLDRKKMCVTEVNSKKAVTNFIVLDRYKNSTFLELSLETGRTHQIRVHMNFIGHSIINDKVYGKRVINDYGQMLHAYYLSFEHPITGKVMEFVSPLPKEFNDILDKLKNL